MRFIWPLLVSLLLAVAVTVAAAAVLSGFKGPQTHTAGEAPEVDVPGPFEIDAGPLDAGRRRITFTDVVNADHVRRFTLTGRLGAAAAGAKLRLRNRRDKTLVHRAHALTDGSFKIPAIRAGEYELTVRDASGRRLREPARVTLDTDLDLDLEDAGKTWAFAVGVRAGKAAAKPLPKACLILTRSGLLIGTATTDAQGRATLGPLETGKVHWVVWASGPEWPPGGREWSGDVELKNGPAPQSITVDR